MSWHRNGLLAASTNIMQVAVGRQALEKRRGIWAAVSRALYLLSVVSRREVSSQRLVAFEHFVAAFFRARPVVEIGEALPNVIPKHAWSCRNEGAATTFHASWMHRIDVSPFRCCSTEDLFAPWAGNLPQA